MTHAANQTAAALPGKTSYRPLYFLALGAFAVGTEGFMIAPMLPDIAKDLSVEVTAAGQLVTIFALAYALSSPVLTAATGRFERRKLLIASMTFFALANLVAAAAPNYLSLAAARVLLALSAGLYVPGANAVAGAMVPPEQRGRALAIVNGGITGAVAIGVPLGAWVGDTVGWRLSFVSVAVLSAVAVLGLLRGLPKGIGSGIPVATLRERIAVARQPVVLTTLLVTSLWAIGAYTIYTYIAPLLRAVAGIRGPDISGVLFLWGIAAAAGLFLGGFGTDRFGSRRVILVTLVTTGIAMASLSALGHLPDPATAVLPVLVAVAVWGAAHWGFWPAQQTRLIEIAGLKAASITLSLNASFMYLGFSLGATLGSVILASASVLDLGWAGSICVLGALCLNFVSGRITKAMQPDRTARR